MPTIPAEKAITVSAQINCDLNTAWNAWTTSEGVKSFFAPACNIELRVGGPYEIFFMPDAPIGSKGGDGMEILAIEPQKMLSFTWNAPPQFPAVRQQKTFVILRFEQMTENQTELSLCHVGWGSSEEWNLTFEYFKKAWGEIVFPRLKKSLAGEPVDWSTM